MKTIQWGYIPITMYTYESWTVTKADRGEMIHLKYGVIREHYGYLDHRKDKQVCPQTN